MSLNQQNDNALSILGKISPFSIFHVNADGNVSYVNSLWEKLIGTPLSNIKGNNWLTIVHFTDTGRVKSEWEAKIGTDVPFTIETRLLVANGSIKWLIIHFHPNPGTTEKIAGYTGCIVDVTEQKTAKQRLNESKLLNKALAENSSEAIIIQTPDTKITFANQIAADLLKADNIETLIGKSTRDFTLPENKQILKKRLSQVTKKGEKAPPFEQGVICIDGTLKYVSSTAIPVVWHGKKAVLLINKDITYIKDHNREVELSERNLQQFIKHTPVAVAMFDRSMNYMACSDRWLIDWWKHPKKMSTESIVGKNHYTLFPDVTDYWKKVHQRALKGAFESNAADYFVQTDGTPQWLKWEVRPWTDNEGNIGGLIIHTEFITKRKQAEKELKRSQQKLSAILQNVPGMVYSTGNDKDWTMRFISSGAYEITGYHDSEFFGKNAVDLTRITHPEDKDRVWHDIRDALDKKEPFEVHYRIITKDKDTKFVLERGQGIFAERGELVSIEGMILDETESQKAGIALRESQARNMALLETLPDAIFINKEDGVILDVQIPRNFSIFFKPDEIIKKNVTEVFGENIGIQFISRFQSIHNVNESRTWEFSCTAEDKKEYFEVRSVWYKENMFLSVIRNITKNKEIAFHALESERRFYQAFHISPIPVKITRLKDRKILDANQKFLDLIQMDSGEVIGKKSIDLNIWQDQELHNAFKEQLVKEGKIYGKETILLNRHNEKRNVLLSAELIQLNKEPTILLMMVDITKRKQTEKELTILADKLMISNQELKQFAYITSHNLRAPVVNIDTLLELYDPKSPLRDTNLEVYKKILLSVDQLKSSLNDLTQLVDLKDHHEIQNETVEFEDILLRVSRAIETQIKEVGATIQADFSHARSITFRPSALESILQNLLINSLKYRGKAPPVITLKTEVIANYTVLTIKDNGIGMDLKKIGHKLFGMYQRFHEAKEGKGLGLYIVKSQIESLGGKIEVESEVNQGTSFMVYFKRY